MFIHETSSGGLALALPPFDESGESEQALKAATALTSGRTADFRKTQIRLMGNLPEDSTAARPPVAAASGDLVLIVS